MYQWSTTNSPYTSVLKQTVHVPVVYKKQSMYQWSTKNSPCTSGLQESPYTSVLKQTVHVPVLYNKPQGESTSLNDTVQLFLDKFMIIL
jgi:hypothetical protein